MGVFKVFLSKGIINAENEVFLTLINKLCYDSLIEIGVKIVAFELSLSKRIVNAENGVFLTLIFSMIPL